MFKKTLLISIVLFLVSGVPALASEVPQWNLDKAHSNFYFSVEHIYSKIQGRFEEYSGEIRFSPDNLEASTFIFEIEVDSINTHIAKRDKHLLSEDFFNEPQYPTMRFESTSITETSPNSYNVAGKFTVKGKSYDLVLPLVFEGMKDHPSIKETSVAGFNGTVTIDRLAHGVGNGKFYDMGLVGKDVEILVSLEVLHKK